MSIFGDLSIFQVPVQAKTRNLIQRNLHQNDTQSAYISSDRNQGRFQNPMVHSTPLANRPVGSARNVGMFQHPMVHSTPLPNPSISSRERSRAALFQHPSYGPSSQNLFAQNHQSSFAFPMPNPMPPPVSNIFLADVEENSHLISGPSFDTRSISRPLISGPSFDTRSTSRPLIPGPSFNTRSISRPLMSGPSFDTRSLTRPEYSSHMSDMNSWAGLGPRSECDWSTASTMQVTKAMEKGLKRYLQTIEDPEKRNFVVEAARGIAQFMPEVTMDDTSVKSHYQKFASSVKNALSVKSMKSMKSITSQRTISKRKAEATVINCSLRKEPNSSDFKITTERRMVAYSSPDSSDSDEECFEKTVLVKRSNDEVAPRLGSLSPERRKFPTEEVQPVKEVNVSSICPNDSATTFTRSGRTVKKPDYFGANDTVASIVVKQLKIKIVAPKSRKVITGKLSKSRENVRSKDKKTDKSDSSKENNGKEEVFKKPAPKGRKKKEDSAPKELPPEKSNGRKRKQESTAQEVPAPPTPKEVIVQTRSGRNVKVANYSEVIGGGKKNKKLDADKENISTKKSKKKTAVLQTPIVQPMCTPAEVKRLNDVVQGIPDSTSAGDLSFADMDMLIPEATKSTRAPSRRRGMKGTIGAATPPLHHFVSNLNPALVSSATPGRQTPDWHLSQRSQSEVKKMQIRKPQKKGKQVKASEPKENKRPKKTKALAIATGLVLGSKPLAPSLGLINRQYHDSDEEEEEDED